MRLVEDATDVAMFEVKRALVRGGRVDGCARVRSLQLRRLNVDNLRCLPWTSGQTSSISSKRCPLHDRCMGHLRSANGTALLLPACTSDPSGPYELSEIDKLTLQLAGGNISLSQYAVNLRNCISGKRGSLKYGCMGFTSLSTARGVATSVWSEPYYEVWMPKRWAERMWIPERTEDGEYSSPYYSWRRVREGDYAILSRCPVLSHESVRCVQLRFWDQPSVGVHPEYCAPLNLDYDGDEVHLSIVSGRECSREALCNLRLGALSKFSRLSVEKALRESNVDSLVADMRCVDFMTTSTLSVDVNVGLNKLTAIHSLSRCKEAQWLAFAGHLESRRARMATFVERCTASVHDLTESHIRVSEGFTMGRQLKHILFQTQSTQRGTLTRWLPVQDRRRLAVQGLWCAAPAYGFPGTRLSSHVSGAVQQALMDRAKHGHREESTSLLLSLLTGKHSFFVTRDLLGRLDVESGDAGRRSALAPLSRSEIAQLSNPSDRYVRCLLAVKLGCLLSRIDAAETEAAELAHTLFSSTYVDPSAAIADGMNVGFLAKTCSPALLTAACDDIYTLDRRFCLPQYSEEMDWCRTDCPVASIITGNYADHVHRSQAGF